MWVDTVIRLLEVTSTTKFRSRLLYSTILNDVLVYFAIRWEVESDNGRNSLVSNSLVQSSKGSWCHTSMSLNWWVVRIGRRFRLRLQCCIETIELRHYYSCMTWTHALRWAVEMEVCGNPPSLSIRKKLLCFRYLGSISQGRKLSWFKIINCWVLGTKRILESDFKKLHLITTKLLQHYLPYMVLNDSLAFITIRWWRELPLVLITWFHLPSRAGFRLHQHHWISGLGDH